ncbi:hypothetical protein FCM35_KLT19937 [Carex littledalei]|uniref:Uncharacterized protein n=1 Tax=Carex littledalei TaxID=544730 RepID=A0A833VP43_9POAL|nr:hypothetical protein FCM35_KLT19937 [Carex littledalei]
MVVLQASVFAFFIPFRWMRKGVISNPKLRERERRLAMNLILYLFFLFWFLGSFTKEPSNQTVKWQRLHLNGRVSSGEKIGRMANLTGLCHSPKNKGRWSPAAYIQLLLYYIK